jgi:5-methyltetrahydropteroyltriglutamate--homocysteine methyltransferase
MTDVVATTPGLLPLPNWAKESLSELKGHQKSDLVSGNEGDETTEVYDRIREEFIGRQQKAGLGRITEGQARWDDMLVHPLAIHDKVETRGIVRYYNNNNFYREPVVTDALSFDGDVAAELGAVESPGNSLQAVLPGPYSLADLATDEHYGDTASFLAGVASFLAQEASALPDHETLFLLEPSLAEAPPNDQLDAAASEAIDEVAAAVDSEVIVHTYFGAVPEKAYAHLMDADVDAIGFDFVTDHEQTLYNIQEYGTKDSVAMGVVDGQNTLIETPAEIRDRVSWVQEQVPAQSFETVYVTANTELFYLPTNKAEAKLNALAAAVTEEVEA